jgi:hypothetical protein
MTFSPAGDSIAMFSTAGMTMPMLDELERSQVLEVDSCTHSEGSEATVIKIKKKFGFTNEIFIDLLIDLIEKYNL